MGLIIFFLIFYFAIGKDSPKIKNFVSDKLGTIIIVLFFFSVFSSVGGTLFGGAIAFLVLSLVFGFMALPFVVVWKIIKSILGIGNNSTAVKAVNVDDSKEKKTNSAGTGLTRSLKKRRKIVDKFNKKYNLSLTDQEIDRMVEASFASSDWEYEIQAMDKEYSAISEWYKGSTGWLRAYMKAFSVQSISSDFLMQKSICLDSFNQIMRELNMNSFSSIEQCINYTNNTYFTFFDDTSFMIAYRFLEKNGIKYDLPGSRILKSESSIESLKRKYDREVNSAPAYNNASSNDDRDLSVRRM